jgi:rRNA maturation endonuclease Nob1
MDPLLDRFMARIRAQVEHRHALNSKGIHYNVWTVWGVHCTRCGSIFEGHRCGLVGSPGEAHRIAQPSAVQEGLW